MTIKFRDGDGSEKYSKSTGTGTGVDPYVNNVNLESLPSGNLDQTTSDAALCVTPATDITDETYIGDIKFGEALPAGTANIGDVDVASLPAANLGMQAMAASVSVVPASDITDATYIGDIKFGEDLPDTTAGDLATINTSTATLAAAVSTEMQCDIVGSLPAGTANIGDVDVASLPSANLGQQAMAASVSVVPASDVTDATYIGDIKFGEELPAGTQNIGDVDIATLPAANLGMQAMAASMSVVPASDVTDATYIGDIKFGEELPAGTQILGSVGIDQTTPGTTNGVAIVGTKGSVTTAHAAIVETTTSAEIDCTGYNGLIVHAVVGTAVKNWTVAVTGSPTSGGDFAACYEGATAMSFQTNASRCVLWKGIPEFVKIVATEDEDTGDCTVKVQPVMI